MSMHCSGTQAAMLPASFKLSRARLSDQVLDRLIDMIARGQLQPGDKLPSEPRLMEQFGVGRSSIREAVGALELLGLLDVRPGDGTRLADASTVMESRAVSLSLVTIGRDAVRDLVEARVDLEQSIAKYAAIRATPEDVNEITRQHRSMASLQNTGRRFIAADLAFHTAIAMASHNSVLIRFFTELRQPVRNWMEQKYRFDWGKAQVVEEHAEIVGAIAAQDAEAAQAAMGRHIERAGDKLVAAMRESPPGLD